MYSHAQMLIFVLNCLKYIDIYSNPFLKEFVIQQRPCCSQSEFIHIVQGLMPRRVTKIWQCGGCHVFWCVSSGPGVDT